MQVQEALARGRNVRPPTHRVPRPCSWLPPRSGEHRGYRDGWPVEDGGWRMEGVRCSVLGGGRWEVGGAGCVARRASTRHARVVARRRPASRVRLPASDFPRPASDFPRPTSRVRRPASTGSDSPEPADEAPTASCRIRSTRSRPPLFLFLFLFPTRRSPQHIEWTHRTYSVSHHLHRRNAALSVALARLERADSSASYF